MNVKHVIYIWNKENYTNRQDAQRDGAIETHEIVVPHEYQNAESLFVNHHLNAYKSALKLSGRVLADDEDVLDFELVKLKPFTVSAEVLEWNTYTTTVYAEKSAEATARVKTVGIVSFEKSDVECGTSGYDGTPIEDNQRAERLVEGEIG
ncbi:hypothetical protein VPHK120G1_0023 [Vibrio phage K120 g1]